MNRVFMTWRKALLVGRTIHIVNKTLMFVTRILANRVVPYERGREGMVVGIASDCDDQQQDGGLRSGDDVGVDRQGE
jgi:hypothetical protein